MAIQAVAHSVWIEPDKDGQLVARFGEFGDAPETSPGYLDNLDTLVVWKTDTNKDPKSLTATKHNDGFSLSASTQASVQAQTGFPVMTRGSSPARKPHFYARWAPNLDQEAEPALTLDILPTGTAGEARVLFRNQPLVGVTVTLYTPEANDQELTTDARGIVRFKSSEKGLFMLKVGRYREERSGFDTGKRFQLVSHNCSLTWVQK